MDHLLRGHIGNLKSALLSLSPTGENGFEGLIGIALSEISGVPFRLAKSGAQFGVDGKTTYEGGSICFEGKRYDDRVPSDKVISKIADLATTDTEVDIWVLGASTQIGSQLADKVRKFGKDNGIAVFVLDWTEIDLPPLAVALVMGGKRVQEFLKGNISNTKLLQDALAALEAVKNSKSFAQQAKQIRPQLNVPTVGWGLAQRENVTWLSDAFSNRKKAKTKLGQPLAPGDTGTVGVIQRKTLIDQLSPYLTTTPDDTVVFILGGEGNGKSWVVGQSWLALERKPLMIFMSPDDFDEVAARNDVIGMLISKLIKQTGDEINETTKNRWRRRLEQWRNYQETEIPRLIAFIDGINQRPKTDWARIIENFNVELSTLGG
jgi:hypothetical protein